MTSETTAVRSRSMSTAPIVGAVSVNRRNAMNMIVSASAVAAATLAPHSTAKADDFDQAGMLERLEQAIHALRTGHVCDGWTLDEAAAARSLAYCRKLASNPTTDDDEEWALQKFIKDHGLSFDWI